MEIDYKHKYLKYKLKYIHLKSQIGGDKIDNYKNNIIENFDELFNSRGYETNGYDDLSKNISDFTNFLTNVTDDNKKIIIQSLDKFTPIINILTIRLKKLKEIINNISSKSCGKTQHCIKSYTEKKDKYKKLKTNLKELIKTLENIHKTYKKQSTK